MSKQVESCEKVFSSLVEKFEGTERYESVKLADISLTPENRDVLKFNGEDYVMTKFAEGGLYNAIGIPCKLSDEIMEYSKDEWQRLYRLMAKHRDKPVKLKFVQDEGGEVVSGIIDGRLSPLSNFDVATLMRDATKGKDYSARVAYDTDDRLCTVITKSDETNLGTKTKPDVFKPGIYVDTSSVGRIRPRISEGMERLVCTNMSYVTERGAGFPIYSDRDQSIKSFTELMAKYLDHGADSQFYADRVKTLKKHNASLEELNRAHRLLSSYVDKEDDVLRGDIEKKLPVQAVCEKYGIESVRSRSPRWRTTATTPVKIWDVFDYVTFFGSNVLSDNDARLSVQIEGGKILTKDPDVLAVAPLVEW